MNERCETCRFWEEDRNKLEIGECRKNAPSIDVNGDGIWPDTFDFEWCGEYQPKKDADQCSE